MSSPIWTPGALGSSARALEGACRRLVEAQHRVSTLKLVDDLDEQAMLERLIEETKPAVPPECRHLHWLLATPFRYAPPRRTGSRFRRPGRTPGVFYAGEAVETAVAEIAFWRLVFYAESPGTPWPRNPGEYTAFSARFATRAALDLTRPPLDEHRALWEHTTDYAHCQALADAARAADIEAIRYRSVRDPRRGANLALLTCRAFTHPEPQAQQSWRIHLQASGVQAVCEFPGARLAFGRDAFANDPRIAGLRWER